MTRVSMAVLFATAIAVPAIPAGQQQAFRGGIHTVPVYASVVDRTGRLVTNLTKDDFEVLDNGTRQDLTLFANDRQPITIVIMLDRSGSVSQHFPLVRDAAAEFVANLNDTDRARIGSFSNTVQIDPVGFTSDRDELRRILRENLQNAGATPLWNAAAAAMRALAEEPGRRVVLMFTDGHDNPNEPEPDHRNTTFPEVRAQVQSDEVMVYGIGLAEDCGTPLPGIRLPRLEQRRPPARGGPGRLPGGRIGGRPPRLPIPFPPMPGGRFPGRGDPIPTPPVPPVVSKRRILRGREAGSRPEGDCHRERRRLLRASRHAAAGVNIRARRRRAPPSVPPRLHAGPRRKNAHARGSRQAGRRRGPRAQELRRAAGALTRTRDRHYFADPITNPIERSSGLKNCP